MLRIVSALSKEDGKNDCLFKRGEEYDAFQNQR